jgi:glycoprotein endo-alpha-1,2-mannosidase
VESVRADLAHLMSQHNTSAGLMRIGGRPVYFMYDSYRLPAEEWARLLGKGGNVTVRGTELDGGLLRSTRCTLHSSVLRLVC